MKSNHLIFGAVTAIILLVDQFSKVYIDHTMRLYQSIPVIDGLFNITYLRNKGAAFSFLADASWRLPFFIAISVIASVVILSVFLRLKADQRFATFNVDLGQRQRRSDQHFGQ